MAIDKKMHRIFFRLVPSAVPTRKNEKTLIRPFLRTLETSLTMRVGKHAHEKYNATANLFPMAYTSVSHRKTRLKGKQSANTSINIAREPKQPLFLNRHFYITP